MTKVVAIDIGHGSDTFPPNKGVYIGGKGYAEHDFNSKVGVELDKLLKHNGFKTIMKQKPFSPDVGLTTRTNYYNAKGVDLVYSLHANYNGNPDVNGRCVFYWHTANDAKELANIIVDEVKKAGYSTHGNGLHASKPNIWTNLHICRETHMTAVLSENGFMSGDKDFELIFGSKQKQYVKDMARVHAKAICRYYGVKFKDLDGTAVADKPSKPSKPASKSISKMAQEVITGKHGNGHDARRKSLGITQAEYDKVRKEVNRRSGIKTASKPKGKTVAQMAQEVIDGKHGNGHANRRKSLGLSSSVYNKVKREVNRRLTGKSAVYSKQKSKSFSVGQKVTVKKSASTFATGESIADFVKGKSYTVKQVKSDRVLLDGIMSWVRKSDVY
ncbi:N-acetylmuramoyl-L-alanine amidase [Virgibacillus chiguensis]|uniref:N-acetylmuramoyl-L-alanine amidase n=1 Tax=Virgibacillus chiguensis TaxID=411959 RepID=A0A1M5SMM1_9BACI|nr:N-acetylmuramoyl-L-alanine amidase [Virgibacillus chiguensis]SHH39767.1 N-acetylmuramoyl-L-alanine amidase [Virgibacillus chiguensis]